MNGDALLFDFWKRIVEQLTPALDGNERLLAPFREGRQHGDMVYLNTLSATTDSVTCTKRKQDLLPAIWLRDASAGSGGQQNVPEDSDVFIRCGKTNIAGTKDGNLVLYTDRKITIVSPDQMIYPSRFPMVIRSIKTTWKLTNLFVDPKGLFWMFGGGLDKKIICFDEELRVLRVIENLQNEPTAIAFFPDGVIVVAENTKMKDYVTSSLIHLYKPESDEPVYQPILCPSKIDNLQVYEGQIYAMTSFFIFVISPDGTIVRMISRCCTVDRFLDCTAFTFTTDGYMLVCESISRSLSVWTHLGDFIYRMALKDRPKDVTILPNGKVVVMSENCFQIIF